MVLKQYQILIQRRIAMIYVGIDVAKDKHDCFMQECLHLLTNQGNWITAMPTWKREVLDILGMLFIMQPSMSATGTNLLVLILPRNELRANTIMLRYLMPLKSL